MQKIIEPSSKKEVKALIIGQSGSKVSQLRNHLAVYFNRVDLLSDLEQLSSLAADSHTIIVVTDTAGDVLNHDLFMNIRSLHPRARLLCLVDRITRQTEKAMRSAGLIFLGSYDHFDDCYGSILQTALARLDPITRQYLQGPKERNLV